MVVETVETLAAHPCFATRARAGVLVVRPVASAVADAKLVRAADSVVAAVPPLATAMVEALQVPVVTVPRVVMVD